MQIDDFSEILSAVAVNLDRTMVSYQEYSPVQPVRLGLWNLVTGESVRSIGNYRDAFRNIVFSPDGRTLVATSNWLETGYDCSYSSSEVTLVDVSTGQAIWKTNTEGALIFGGITLTGDGSKIVGVAPDCGDPLYVYDAATGEEVGPWVGHDDGVNGVSASRDGT